MLERTGTDVCHFRTGDVNIAIEGTNIPDATGDAEVLAPQRRSRIANRGLFSSIENAFKSKSPSQKLSSHSY